MKKNGEQLVESQNASIRFLEELANLSKRGFLDEGIYLTDVGSDVLKKLKVKPAPSSKRRARNTGNANSNANNNNNVSAEMESKVEKHDENSHSSCEFNDEEHTGEVKHSDANKQRQPAKRYINIGLGGFNLKFRSRAKMQQNETPAEAAAAAAAAAAEETRTGSTTIKRKKKITIEDTIPAYMQEAFFGTLTLSTCNDDRGGGDAAAASEEQAIKLEQARKLAANRDLHHRINLDENMLKLAQQKQRGHLELGIEDFLDGDIVSYLFNDNRNLMEFNTDHDLAPPGNTNPNNSSNSNTNKNRLLKDSNNFDEKIFDEKIYEDLFHQMDAAGTPKSHPNSVDDYLNLSDTHNIVDAVSFGGHESQMVKSSTTSNNPHHLMSGDGFTNLNQLSSSSINHSTVAKQPSESSSSSSSSSSNSGLANNTPVLPSHHHHNQLHTHHSHSQAMSSGSGNIVNDVHMMSDSHNSDNRNIDDLARQFRESTHKYAQNTSAPPPHMNMNGTGANMHPAQIQQQQHSHQQHQPQHSQQPHLHQPFETKQQTEMPPMMNSMINNNQAANVGFAMMPGDMKRENIILPNQPQHQQHHHLLQHHMHQQQQQSQVIPIEAIATPINNNNTNNSNQFNNMILPGSSNVGSNAADSIPKFSSSDEPPPISFDDADLSNDAFCGVGGGAKGSGAPGTDVSRQKQLLQKYAEDEELGEMSTQAMSLYCNVNFPNLKNEMKGTCIFWIVLF